MGEAKELAYKLAMNTPEPCAECGTPVAPIDAGGTCDGCGASFCKECAADHETEYCPACWDSRVIYREG